MERQELLGFLQGTNGRFFSVRFIKKNGEERDMVARLGVKKGVTGKGMPYDPISRGLLPVWDVNKGAFRMINLKTTKRVRYGGEEYTVEAV